jgi:hypothetical protein
MKEELDEGSFGTVCPSPEPSAHTVLRRKPGFGFNIYRDNIGRGTEFRHSDRSTGENYSKAGIPVR